MTWGISLEPKSKWSFYKFSKTSKQFFLQLKTISTPELRAIIVEQDSWKRYSEVYLKTFITSK